jgi:hypothetical protein
MVKNITINIPEILKQLPEKLDHFSKDYTFSNF